MFKASGRQQNVSQGMSTENWDYTYSQKTCNSTGAETLLRKLCLVAEVQNSNNRTEVAHGCWNEPLTCWVRDNAQTVSQRDGIQGVNVEKHCCSHSTGTAEAAMQTRSHCSLCLGMLPLRLKDNNSFSLSLQCMAFLWRWVPVSTGCVSASYNRGLLYPWLCSLYSSSAWKGKISLLK